MSIRIWLTALLALLLAIAGFAQDQGTTNTTTTTTGVITDIKVTGNDHVSTDAILSRMKTKVGQPYVQSQLDQDRDSIQQLGFFRSVDVNAALIEGTSWRVNVVVSEYPIVKEFRVTGNTVISSDAIQKVVTIKVGQPFNVTAAEPTSQAISKLYTDHGYFGLVTDIEPIESSGTVNISIEEVRVNSVGVEGNTRTRNYVMRRLIKTKPGEAYNVRKWDNDLRRLVGTRWFDNVQPDDHQTADGTGIDLLAVVKEARTGQAVVGVSLDPTTSLAGDASLSDTNFNGTGQSIGVSFMQAITGGGPSVDLHYGNPFIDTHDTALSLSLYSHLIYRFTGSGFGEIASTSQTLYTERRTGFATSLSRPVGDQETATFGVRAEAVKTSNLSQAQQNTFIRQDGRVGTLLLGYNRNRRDVDIDPSRGDWLNYSIEPGLANIDEIGGALSDQNVLGTHSFLRNQIEYRTYFAFKQPPRGRNFDAPRKVLAIRLRYGEISGTVPFFEQFFVGGTDSVRGYDDDRFWGKQMFIGTAEYRYPLQKSFDLIPFLDYGGAWGGYGAVNNFSQYNDFRLHLGYGLGVSFRTPLGSIRIDFGVNEKGGNRTHFLIGSSF